MDGSVRMGFYLFSKSLHALEAKGFRQGLYSVGTFTMGDKMENQESGKVTGCKLCLENYEVGSKHYCSVNGLQAALRESRNYVGTLESQLSSLRQSAKDVLCNVHQLIEGWHTDVAWTEYDQSVLKSVEELQHRIEK